MPPRREDGSSLSEGGHQNISGDSQPAGTPEATNNNSTQEEEMTFPQEGEEVGTSTTYTNVNGNGDTVAQSGSDLDYEDEAGLQNQHDNQDSPTHNSLLSNNESAEEHTEQRRTETGRASETLSGGSTTSSYATNIDHYDITGAAASTISGTSTSSGSSWLSRHFADMNTEATPPGTRTRSTTRPSPMLGVENAATDATDATSTNVHCPRRVGGADSIKDEDVIAKAKAKEEQEEEKKLRAERAHSSADEQGTSISDGSSSNEAIASMRGDASTILSSTSIISAISAPESASEGSTAISSLTSPTFHSMNGDDGLTLRSRSRSRSRSRDMLPTIPSDSDDDDNDVDSTSRGDTSIFNERAAAAIRRSIHETPGAYHVTPIYAGENAADSSTVEDSMATGTSTSTVTFGSSNSNSNNGVDSGEQTPEDREVVSSRRRSRRNTPSSSRATLSSNGSWDVSIELAEAWVVEEGGDGAGPPATATSAQPTGLTSDSSSASTGIDASVEPAVVTVTATPFKERRWFKTPSGIILLIFLLGGVVALAVGVAIPDRKKASNAAAAATRPFEIVIPSMPRDVSDMLEFKYNKVIKGQPIPMAFSADLSLHASSRIDEWYGQLQIVQYDANSTSWYVAAKYDAKEARKDEFKNDIQHGNSPGDNFGAWVDMSYDGRILAVGLPRDDPSNIPDAGSVLVMKMGKSLDENDLDLNDDVQYPWDLKGHGDFIVGVDPFSWTGSTFSLTADGSMIAVASPVASKGRGNIMVYKFESDDVTANGGIWIKIGQTITGDAFGSALSFAKLTEDGRVLGAGSFLNGDDQSGQFRIFRWDDALNLWVQMGSTFEGKAKARLGVFPHFSRDGRTVAFSQTGDPHKCHVYQWDEVDNDWGRIDDEQVFPDHYICMDLSPDGKKVILCSTDEQQCILNLLHSGGEWHKAQVFPEVDGFMPYHFERDGDGDKIAGIVVPIGNEEGYTIGFYNIN